MAPVLKSHKIGVLTPKRCIDLNCDVGESYGAYTIGNDDVLLKLASSVNIACGFHGGDAAVMRRTVELAVANNVAIGAHPGLPDLAGFGRRVMQVSAQEVYDMTLYQIAALEGFVLVAGGVMKHVKPHGALYNMLAPNETLSRGFVRAVADFDKSLTVVGLAGSIFLKTALDAGLKVAHEAFADRSYQADGSLTPRTNKGAIVSSAGEAAVQAVRIAVEKRVFSMSGAELSINAQTICLHGDSPHSAKYARAVVRSLKAAGVEIRALV
ncbi:MAG: LamB/YcsF family protein [Candidatus Kapabacteria bacterium]|nr:LamB/YcsF family protein [Candidatus Kapabacteria bacterium]